MKIIDSENKVINLTNSTRATFDTCRRKFFYGNMLNGHGVRPYGVQSGALLYGNIIHEMFATAIKGGSDEEIQRAGLAPVLDCENEIIEPGMKAQIYLVTGRVLAEALVDVANTVAEIYNDRFNICGVEEHKHLTIGRLSHFETDDVYEVKLHGVLDVLASNTDDDTVVIDHKTVSAFKSAFYERCTIDHQPTTYLLLASDGLIPLDSKYHMYYNVFRKPTIRQRKNELPESYAERVRAYYKDMKTEEYLKEVYTYRTPQQLYDMKQLYLNVAEDILAAKTFRQNTAHCDLYAGCPYLSLCKNGPADLVNYMDKRSTHEEINDTDEEVW